MIVGGIPLFVLAMGDLLAHERLQRRMDTGGFGAVPLGVLLITGPAATAAALVVSTPVAGIVFRLAATSIACWEALAQASFSRWRACLSRPFMLAVGADP